MNLIGLLLVSEAFNFLPFSSVVHQFFVAAAAAIALYLPIDLVFRISFSKPAPRSYMYLLAISAVFSLCGANVYVWVQGAPFNYFLLILAVTITSFMTLFTVYFFRLRRALSVAHLLPGSSASGAPGLPTSPTHSRNQRRTTPPSQLATAGTCSLSDRESDRSTSFEFTPPPPAVHQPKCSAEVARALRHLSVLYVGFFAVTAICVPLQVYFMAVGSNAVRAPTGDQYPSNLSESHTPFSLVQAMALALYLYFGRLPLSELCHREQPISLAIASGRAHTQGLATAHVPKTLTAASTQSGKSAVTPPALAVLDVASGGGGGGGANVRLMSAVINPTDDSAGESIRVVTVLLESESASGHTPRATTVKLSELQPAQCHAMAGAPFECGRVHAHGHAGHEPGQPSSDSLHMPQLT